MRMGSLTEASQYFSGRSLQIDEEYCINLRGRQELCANCVEACPHAALTLSLDAVSVDKARCLGCGSCVPRCPAGALNLSGFAPRRLMELVKPGEPLSLHCRESRAQSGGVVVPCHGVVDARLLLALSAQGATRIEFHGLERCGECEVADARGLLSAAIDGAQGLTSDGFVQVDLAPEVKPKRGRGPRDYADQPQLSRRGFLRMAGAQSLVEGAGYWVAAEEETDFETLPFFQPQDHPQRPHAYHAMLTDYAATIPWREGAVLPWPQKAISDACSACMSCAERCPTGALEGGGGGVARRIQFHGQRCTDCTLCDAICPERAMVSRARYRLPESEPSTLLFRRWRSCDRCGDAFAPEGNANHCAICRNEAEMDDEWMRLLGG